MAFDYDSPDGPDPDAIRSIAADMANAGKPPAMSDAERQDWQEWREQQEWLAEHQRRENERQHAEAAEAERAEADRQAAIARAEARQRAQDELRERTRRQSHDGTLVGILNHAIEQRQFRHTTMRSAHLAASRQRLSTALGNAVELKNPPPLPEPEVEPDPPWRLGPNFDPTKSRW